MSSDLMHDSAKREALAQRMSKLLGLPLSNIQMLMPLIPMEELDKLAGVPDDQFLKESTRLINQAQQSQFGDGEDGDDQDEADAPEEDAPAAPKRQLSLPTAGTPSEPEEAEPESLVPEHEPGQPVELPSAFHVRGKKHETAAEKRKILLLLGGAGVIALAFVALSAWFIITVIMDPGTFIPPTILPRRHRPDNGNGNGEAPAKLVSKHAWQIKESLALQVERAELLAQTEGAFTVEFWAKIDNAAGLQELAVVGSGEEEVFALACRTNQGGQMTAQFSVPGLSDEVAAALFPATGEWTHVAGVYQPEEANALLLFVNGAPVNSVPCRDEPGTLAPTGYAVRAMVEGEEADATFDELRILAAAVYTGPFEPARVLEPSEKVAALIHFEKHEDGMVRDLGSGEGETFELPGGELVLVGEASTAGQTVAADGPIEFPQDLVKQMISEKGTEKVAEFLEAFNGLTREEQIEFLTDIGYYKADARDI